MPSIRLRSAVLLAGFALSLGVASAQDTTDPSSPAGLSMLVLFMGIAAIVAVFAIRWSQSTQEEDD